MRVVAGELRGRPLVCAPGRETRPTSARARGGLFDWLGDCVRAARVLDLFAGSGALGIEAVSRGAGSVVFVERASPALAALRTNLDALGLRQSTQAVRADVRRFLGSASAGEAYDLVLADPPYAGRWIADLLSDSRVVDLLAPEGCLVVEGPARESMPEPGPGLAAVGERCYGETLFARFHKRQPKEARA